MLVLKLSEQKFSLHTTTLTQVMNTSTVWLGRLVVGTNIRHRSCLFTRRRLFEITVSTSAFHNREYGLCYVSYTPFIISENNEDEATAVIVS